VIYTSYFSKLRYLPDNAMPVSISLSSPGWYKGKRYKILAPSWSILSEWRQTHNEERYVQRFNDEILGRLHPDGIYRNLCSLAWPYEDVVLLCYERPSDFCHRHLVAAWLERNGYPCREMEL